MPRKKKTQVNYSEIGNLRFLHFGSEWVQGAMNKCRSHQLALDYQRYMMSLMLFLPDPKEVLQLGLGAAGLAKYTYYFVPSAHTRVVEISEDVYNAARMWFRMPADNERLTTIIEDCKTYLPKAENSSDWLLVDIYDAEAWGPVYDDVPFYRLCKNSLKNGGIASFNVFGGADFLKSLDAISEAFDRNVLVLPEVAEGNRIILAKRGERELYQGALLDRRAAEMSANKHLPGKRLLQQLRIENGWENDIYF